MLRLPAAPFVGCKHVFARYDSPIHVVLGPSPISRRPGATEIQHFRCVCIENGQRSIYSHQGSFQ